MGDERQEASEVSRVSLPWGQYECSSWGPGVDGSEYGRLYAKRMDSGRVLGWSLGEGSMEFEGWPNRNNQRAEGRRDDGMECGRKGQRRRRKEGGASRNSKTQNVSERGAVDDMW